MQVDNIIFYKLYVTIGSTLFTAVPGTFQVFTPPPTAFSTPLSNPLMVILVLSYTIKNSCMCCVCNCN